MFNKVIVSAMVACSTLCAQAQTGAWSGNIEVQGMKIEMTFNLTDNNCTLDVPAQGAKGIPAKLTRNADGSIEIGIPSINGSYKGKLEEGTIQGLFTQHGYSFAMPLTPGAPKINRPQTPQGPFPYTTEEVSFVNGDATLSGTLVLPKDWNKETPVAIMITGSGVQNRDEEIFEHKPFLVIADALAKQGIATLRYDDRGFAKSTGDLVNVTTLDLKNDALAGIKLLRDRFQHVGVIGHSEGGTIAFMLAAEGQVDFVVSLAGSVLSGLDILIDQNRDQLQLMGVPASDTDNYCQALKKGFETLAAGKALNEVPAPTNLSVAMSNQYNLVMKQAASPYMRYFLTLAGRDYLDKIHCPVIAFNGTLDRQVDANKHLPILEKGLTHCSHKIVSKEGLNHLFQHCQSGLITEYATIEETFSPEVISEMISWLKALNL